MVAGVCGGLGRYFDVNPAYYRVGFVVLALIGGAGILIYLAALLVIPEEGEDDSIASRILRNHRNQPLALVALAIVAVAGLAAASHATLWPHGDVAWVLLLVAGGVLLWTQRRKDGRRRRWVRGLLITLAVLVALVLAVGAVVASVSGVHVSRGVGDRNFQIASYSGLSRDYKLGVGSLRLDLSAVRLPPGDTPLDANVGIGNVQITVPRDATVVADASARLGEVDVFDRSDSGSHTSIATTRVAGDASRRLVIHAHVGTGRVEIRRSLR